jgi:hypothetical protein
MNSLYFRVVYKEKIFYVLKSDITARKRTFERVCSHPLPHSVSPLQLLLGYITTGLRPPLWHWLASFVSTLKGKGSREKKQRTDEILTLSFSDYFLVSFCLSSIVSFSQPLIYLSFSNRAHKYPLNILTLH